MPELDEQQQKKLEEKFHGDLEKVSKSDVQRALEKVEPVLRKLGGSTVEKVRVMAKQATLVFEMLKSWWKGEIDLPWKTVAAMTVSLLYLASPIDLLPDFFPLAGYLDDIFIVAVALELVQDELKDFAEKKGLDLKEYGL
ncbi:MAG: DUF1232 domain-containing protein [Synergistaceae bacterium]|jgi:uncharacterized membrane protein YkvA (DUF1232 family)|nr:DUF1232 domain-containing protein [Synergistaceae bacterium]